MKILATWFVIGSLSWAGLWRTPDQEGQHKMDQGHYEAAAEAFRDPVRKGIAWYRAGEFEKAGQAFARVAAPEAEYNRGNCLLFRGKYEDAVVHYDKALELRPDWEDPKINRSIALARSKQTEAPGGKMGDQQIGADEIVFDKKKNSGGQDTELDEEKVTSDKTMQELWLRRVQTRPAEFLQAKFSYQVAMERSGAGDAE